MLFKGLNMPKYTFRREIYEIIVLEDGKAIAMCINPEIAARIVRLFEKEEKRLARLKAKEE